MSIRPARAPRAAFAACGLLAFVGCQSSGGPPGGALGPASAGDAGMVDVSAPAIDASAPSRSPSSAQGPDGNAANPAADAAALAEASGLSDAEADAGQGSATEDAAWRFDGAAMEGGTDLSIESVTVPATGSVSFKTSLSSGALYLLKATGTLTAGSAMQDAEFGGFTAGGSGASDVVAGTDVGIDVGLLQVHPMNHTTFVAPGPGRAKWFGAFRPDHTYYMTITGAGTALTLRAITAAGGGAGSIVVSLFDLAPAPPPSFTPIPAPAPAPPGAPALGSALDTVQVPVAKTLVASRVSPVRNGVFLLEASGAAKAGGGGLSMGDADYMDWAADGNGHNDGELNVDFGLGVDDVNVGQAGPMNGATYGHRLHWWGEYRNDHVYYMLYTGTGSPISLLYWDTGYADNSTVDTLTFRVFAVP